MAKVSNNIVTTGLSGKLGDLIVFSNRGGKTVVSQAPKERTGEFSEAQKAVHLRFQEAILYAKSSLKDEQTKEAYKASAKPGQSAYNVAIADFMHAPHIDEVDISQYNGEPGSKIRIRALDDFSVAEVSVSVVGTDSTELESGMAVLQPDAWWEYTTTGANENLQVAKIIIRVTDLPGNLSEKEQEL